MSRVKHIMDNMSNSKKTKIKYAEIWGLREEKYKWLQKHEVKNTKWQELSPDDPYYFFIPRDTAGWDLYQNFWKVTDIFPVNSVGIVTARDNFVVDTDKQALESRIKIFRGQREDNDFVKTAYGLEDRATSRWSVKEARRALRETVGWEDHLTKILYRPFDERWIYYHPAVIERHRENVMKHLLRPNLGLIVNRTIKTENIDHFWVTNGINDLHILEAANASAYTLPIYLYTDTQAEERKKKKSFGVTAMMLFDKPRDGGYKVKKPNINPELHALLNNTYNPQPVTTPLDKQKAFDVPPEEIFYYIYAVLYSNTYRQKYQEFLKIDFPRVPFTKDYKLFKKLGKLGEQLVELHLLKSKELAKPITKFQGKDSNVVEKREYKKGRIYINDEQYFEGIKPEVWEYQIGGYQVLDKWLKDRKGRALSSEDIKHYCKVVTTLQKTIKLQEKIDKLYSEAERNLAGP